MEHTRARRRVPAVVLSIAFAVGAAFPGGSDAFSLDPATDLFIGVPAAAAFAAGRLVPQRPLADAPFGWFDEGLGVPYSGALDKAGDVLSLAGIAALPLLLDRADLRSAATVGAMYAEAALLAVGVKDVLKAVVGRPRPYAFDPSAPADLRSDEDVAASFPSGHATVAFMTAAFSTYVFGRSDAPPQAKWALGAGTFALACGTAGLRVAAGVHHPADIAAGAALGTLIGIAVPWFHENRGTDADRPARLAAGPGGVVVSFSY